MRISGRVFLVFLSIFLTLPLLGQGRPWDPAGMRMEARELAPGIYQVAASDVDEKDHTGTNAGIIIGSRGVLVVESLINGDLASQLLAEIRKKTELPIQYLVNTSFHGDHVYGNFAFPESTEIIGHPVTKRYIAEKFEEDRAFMLSIMGKGRGLEAVVPRAPTRIVSDKLELDLGDRMVEILHIGFAQTEGDLVIRLPKENIVFVGNMLQAPPPALPWLLEGRPAEAIETYQRLYDMIDDETVIVPGHGRPMRREHILFTIQYIRELVEKVQTAVDNGLSLEETVEAVTMEGYSSYSLFAFAHGQINVPAVYRDLTERER